MSLETIWVEPRPAIKPEAVRRAERQRAAVKALYAELAEVLDVAIARGEQLGYADEDYRRRLSQVRPRAEL